jgi:menaquinone-9 beta-reductase
VIDRAEFPRDKTCAGWITPQVIDELAIDLDDYRPRRTFQPITGFRTGVIGGATAIETRYPAPVSYGIRRCEFDHYLLQRSGARLRLGTPIQSMHYAAGRWVVNDAITASLLVGAGGHFCPVARHLNGPPAAGAVVVAQEAEFAIHPQQATGFTTAPEYPELYFCSDMQGYGWCFRKQDHLNVGFGRLDHRSLPKATAVFLAFLKARGTIPPHASFRWRGHAYALYGGGSRRTTGGGVLLIGDAAGLAYPQSGEGIRPAIESGLLAAATIREAAGDYSADRLERYQARLTARFGPNPSPSRVLQKLPPSLVTALASRLLTIRPFVRHVVLNRWFLHANEAAL